MKNIIKMRILILCASLLIASGCNQIIIKPNEAGYYDTSQVLFDNDVKFVNYDVEHDKYKKLVFLDTNIHSNKSDFGKDPELKQYFTKLDMFDQVVLQDEMEQIVFDRKLYEKIPNVSDLVALHHLSKDIGDFLYVKYSQRFAGGYTYEASLKAYDTSDGELVLDLYYKGYSIVRPLINGFIDWMNGKNITTTGEMRGEET